MKVTEVAIADFAEKDMIQSADCLQWEEEETQSVRGWVCPIDKRIGTRLLVTIVVAHNPQPVVYSWHCTMELSKSKVVKNMNLVRNKTRTVGNGDNLLRYNPTAASSQWDWQCCERVS